MAQLGGQLSEGEQTWECERRKRLYQICIH